MSSDVSLLDHSEPRSIKMFRPRMAQRVEVSPNVRDFWNLESREILFVESGKQFKESGIPVTIRIQNPSSTIKTGIQYLESAAWNPEYKNVLDSLGRGDS